MIHHIDNGILSVDVDSLGAALASLKKDGTEYLWQGDPKYWAGRDLNPFPYVARLTDGQYMMDGNLYSMPIHGIAPTSGFTCTDASGSAVTLTLKSSPDTLRRYPRAFVFSVRFELEGSRLIKTFTVKNTGDKTMIFGLSGHPGFRVPIDGTTAFEDWYLDFGPAADAARRVRFSEDCFVTFDADPYGGIKEGRLPLRHDLFDDDAIVLRDIPRKVCLRSERSPFSVTVEFPQMPYLGLWHMPRTDAPYVCIEPWCTLPSRKGIVEAFETQPGLLRLTTGEIYENVWSISLT